MATREAESFLGIPMRDLHWTYASSVQGFVVLSILAILILVGIEFGHNQKNYQELILLNAKIDSLTNLTNLILSETLESSAWEYCTSLNAASGDTNDLGFIDMGVCVEAGVSF